MDTQETEVFRVCVLEGRNLCTGPSRLTSDSLVQVEVRIFGGASQTDETNIVRNSTHPKWKALFDFIVQKSSLIDTIAVFKVWDTRAVGRVFLGQVALPLSELPQDSSYDNAEAAWYHLEMPREKSTSSRLIRLRVGLVRGEENMLLLGREFSPESNDDETWQIVEDAPLMNTIEQAVPLPAWQIIPTHEHGANEQEDLVSSESSTDWTELESSIETTQMIVMGSYTNDSKLPSSSSSPFAVSLRDKTPSSRVIGILSLTLLRVAQIGLEIDAFVVITFGTNSYRSKVTRQGRRGKDWQETVVLLIKEANQNHLIKFSLYARGKFKSENDLIAHCFVKVQDLLAIEDKSADAHLQLKMIQQDGINNSALCVRAQFLPFSKMIKKFWNNFARQYALTYTDEENVKLTKLEVWEMLNSVDGSLDDFFDAMGPVDDQGIVVNDLLDSSEMTGTTLSNTLEQLLQSKEGSQMAVPLIMAANDKKGNMEEMHEFIMSGFLTETYARKGWFSRLLTNITNGTYDIGKDNANVLVLNRLTGQLIDEKMPMYIRLGIRAIYRSRLSPLRTVGLDSKMVRAFLANQTTKQGKKFDDPSSAAYIKTFVKFHEINVEEVLNPLDSFRTFNEFFYRKLKPDARQLPSNDNCIAVSPADCRIMLFQTVADATRLWIKGKEFSLENLLGSKPLAEYFEGGSIAVCRLAPQDYHRFHSPVEGVLGKVREINGTYYTVNPMAVRERDVDVFTENKRVVVTILSNQFETVGYVLVGAMLVGSIILTASRGTQLHRLDEIGYFAFGGSTVICLFKKGAIQFDADILENSAKQLETLVRVGNSIGRALQPLK